MPHAHVGCTHVHTLHQSGDSNLCICQPWPMAVWVSGLRVTSSIVAQRGQRLGDSLPHGRRENLILCNNQSLDGRAVGLESAAGGPRGRVRTARGDGRSQDATAGAGGGASDGATTVKPVKALRSRLSSLHCKLEPPAPPASPRWRCRSRVTWSPAQPSSLESRQIGQIGLFSSQLFSSTRHLSKHARRHGESEREALALASF
jgi:hypothetical protein